MVLVVVLIFVVAFPAVHFLGKAYAPVSDQDVIAFGIVNGAAAGTDSARLYRAFLSRARRYRTTASVLTWLSAIVLTYALGGSTITFGLGGPVGSDLLVMGLSGYLAGAVVAELHHLFRHRGTVRLASLVPRRADDYVPASLQRGLGTLGALAGLTVVAAVVGGVVSGSYPWDVAVFGVAAIVVCGLVELTVRSVVHRPRPALPEELARGDDAIRACAARSLVVGGSGLAVLLLGDACARAAVNFGGANVALFLAALFLALGLGVALSFRARRLVWPLRKIELEGARA